MLNAIHKKSGEIVSSLQLYYGDLDYTRSDVFMCPQCEELVIPKFPSFEYKDNRTSSRALVSDENLLPYNFNLNLEDQIFYEDIADDREQIPLFHEDKNLDGFIPHFSHLPHTPSKVLEDPECPLRSSNYQKQARILTCVLEIARLFGEHTKNVNDLDIRENLHDFDAVMFIKDYKIGIIHSQNRNPNSLLVDFVIPILRWDLLLKNTSQEQPRRFFKIDSGFFFSQPILFSDNFKRKFENGSLMFCPKRLDFLRVYRGYWVHDENSHYIQNFFEFQENFLISKKDVVHLYEIDHFLFQGHISATNEEIDKIKGFLDSGNTSRVRGFRFKKDTISRIYRHAHGAAIESLSFDSFMESDHFMKIKTLHELISFEKSKNKELADKLESLKNLPKPENKAKIADLEIKNATLLRELDTARSLISFEKSKNKELADKLESLENLPKPENKAKIADMIELIEKNNKQTLEVIGLWPAALGLWPEGLYHLQIETVKWHQTFKGKFALEIDFLSIEGKTKGGRFSDKLWMNAKWKIEQLLVSTGFDEVEHFPMKGSSSCYSRTAETTLSEMFVGKCIKAVIEIEDERHFKGKIYPARNSIVRILERENGSIRANHTDSVPDWHEPF